MSIRRGRGVATASALIPFPPIPDNGGAAGVQEIRFYVI
jgi:hypothetical protein